MHADDIIQETYTRLIGADSYFRVHRPKRVRQPGEFSAYSNFGVALAARALQQTARAKDVPTLMETRIFQPLGMSHTSLREPYSPQGLDLEDLPSPLSAELTQDLSDGFVWDGATYEAQPFEHAFTGTGDFPTMFFKKLRNWVDGCTTGAELLAPGEAGIAIQKILDGVYRSAAAGGKEVKID